MGQVNSQKNSPNEVEDIVQHTAFKQAGYKNVGVLDLFAVYTDIGDGVGIKFDFPEKITDVNHQKNQNDYSDDNHIPRSP